VALPAACLLGAATAIVPSLASGSSPPTSASFTAIDDAWEANGSPTSTQVTIAQGGTVTFSYPSGGTQHNADFGSGLAPSGCTQTAGPSSGAVPPLPHSQTPPGWSGSCTFNTPGTYTFHCDLHSFMTGTIVVQAPGSSTTSTTTTTTTTATTPATQPGTTTVAPPTTTTTTTPAPPSGGSGQSAGSPVAGTAASAFSIAARQRGYLVRGSVRIAEAGAGGKLEVDLFAGARALARRGRGLLRVGRTVFSPLTPGTARFSAPLDAVANRALRRHPLTLTVVVTVRSPGGRAASVTRTIVLRR
jgi:plastocyanin